MSTLTLVLTAVGSVLLLLFFVMYARLHAFIALMIVAIGAGIFSGMPLEKSRKPCKTEWGELWVFSPSWSPWGQCLVKFCMKRGH